MQLSIYILKFKVPNLNFKDPRTVNDVLTAQMQESDSREA